MGKLQSKGWLASVCNPSLNQYFEVHRKTPLKAFVQLSIFFAV